MKKTTLLVLFGLTVLTPFIAFGSTFNAGETYLLPVGQVITGDLYAAGGNISIGGNVSEDVVAAGGVIAISGNIGRDLIAAGGNIDVLGGVGDDVRIAGGDLVLGGKIGGDLIVGGGSVRVLSGAVINGDVRVGAGSLIFEGTAVGSIEVAGGEVIFNGTARKNVSAKVGKLTVGENANIAGNLSYASEDDAKISESAKIGGTVTKEAVTRPNTADIKGAMAGIMGVFSLFMLITILITALIIVKFLPRFSNKAYGYARNHFGRSLVAGFAGLVLIPIAGIVLLVTLLGSFFGVVTLFGYIILIIFAKVYSGIFFGGFFNKYILKKDSDINWQSTFIGVVLLSLICIIPVVGLVIAGISFLVAFGALIQTKYSYLQ